jgi:hypothetical protein
MAIDEVTPFLGKNTIIFETPPDILIPPFENTDENPKLDGIDGIEVQRVL